MGNSKYVCSLEPEAVQKIVDGTLCLSESPTPGTTGLLAAFPMLGPTQIQTLLYCEYWSDEDRLAFWRGFLRRLGDYQDQVLDLIQWLQDALGQGDQEGDFKQAWKDLASGGYALSQLVMKILVVIQVPISFYHPKREEYRDELVKLGLQLTDDFVEDIKKSYREGGIPQCAGRLLADILVILFEIVATKGAGKAMKAVKASKLVDLVPQQLQNRLRNTLPDKKSIPDGQQKNPFAGMTDEEFEIAFEKAFAEMSSPGAMLSDLMFHGDRKLALEQLRAKLGNVKSKPGKTPKGVDVNPDPGYQSAHITPQSALRELAEYNPNEMITRFLPTGKGHAHTLFDQHWQKQFRDIANQTGQKTITVGELEEVIKRAAYESGAFSPAEAYSMAELVKNDLYFQLGLSPDDVVRLPGS